MRMGQKDGWLSVLLICHMIPRILHQGSWSNSCDAVRIKIYLIVGCDSNAHFTAWGSTNCNGRGKALMEFLQIWRVLTGAMSSLYRAPCWYAWSGTLGTPIGGSFQEDLREKLERVPEMRPDGPRKMRLD